MTQPTQSIGTAADLVLHTEILDAIPDMCFLLSQEGFIMGTNKRALTRLKVAHDRLLNRPFYSILPNEEKSRFQDSFSACLLSGDGQSFEAHLAISDDHRFDVSMFIGRYLLPDDPRQLLCLITARDISDSKQKDLDLLRFSNVAHYTVNPIEITDPAGKIIYVNPAFEKASGYSKEELIGRNPNVFGSGKHPKSFWLEMWKTILGGNVWVGEVENRRRSGDPFITQLLISPIVDADGKVIGFFGVHRDITEQRHLEKQLLQVQKMESIGLLAAGIAHEVGNPLTSISSLVQIIQRTTTQDEFTREKLELIKSQITRISRIIRDLVDFSRRSSYEVQPTDINKCLRDAIEIVKVGRKARQVTFELGLAENLPVLPLIPDQVEQVIINILINAIDSVHDKITRSPGRNEKGLVTLSSAITGGEVEIRISDNGRGIKPELLGKLFEPFFTTKKVGEGTGLGLWVSYGIVKSFQGDLRVESSGEGSGATFIITLPATERAPG